jgi:hypothetical protein
MEFGVFTFIISENILTSIKTFMDYEIEPDKYSQLLFTYDKEPNDIREFVMNDKHSLQNKCFYYHNYFPSRFQLQTEKGMVVFIKIEPIFSQERGLYTLKSLQQIFHKHSNWSIYKPSIYNCVYYVYADTLKIAVFSILKISSKRYLFAYHPKYLNKPEVEQIVFELFIKTA